jgi:hypothetical protein
LPLHCNTACCHLSNSTCPVATVHILDANSGTLVVRMSNQSAHPQMGTSDWTFWKQVFHCWHQVICMWATGQVQEYCVSSDHTKQMQVESALCQSQSNPIPPILVLVKARTGVACWGCGTSGGSSGFESCFPHSNLRKKIEKSL